MNSFEIILKNNRGEIEIIVTRALLAIGGVASFVYAGDGNYYSRIALGLLLFLMSFFVKTILDKYKVKRLMLMAIAAALTYFTTGSIAFALVLLLHGVFFDMLNKKLKVEINERGIAIQYVFGSKTHGWSEINNLILKDGILTVDFASNKLLQAEIAAESFDIDEKLFNRYCTLHVQNQSGKIE
jgi:hypothetical protein